MGLATPAARGDGLHAGAAQPMLQQAALPPLPRSPTVLPPPGFMRSSLNELNEYHTIRSNAMEDAMADLVLLTGISGFLGGHVALELLKPAIGCAAASAISAGPTRSGQALAKPAATCRGSNSSRSTSLPTPAGPRRCGARATSSTPPRPSSARMPRDKMELIRPAVDGTRRALEAALAAECRARRPHLVDGGHLPMATTTTRTAPVRPPPTGPTQRPRRQRLCRIQDPRRARGLDDHGRAPAATTTSP